MSNDKDATNMVILKVDYIELVVPADAAMAFMKQITGGDICKLYNKWMDKSKSSIEVLEHVEVSIHHLSRERYAIAKMTTASLKDEAQ